MQSKCMLRVLDDVIKSGACVTSYGLQLSATPLLRAHMTSYIEQIHAGSQKFDDCLKLSQWRLP